jgi:two-component system, NtrC family, response regulator
VIPPLRERPEDVIPLANYFLDSLPHTGPQVGISKEAQTILSAYPWPGNIRELKAVIRKCALLTDSDMIQSDDLPAHMKAMHYESPHKSKTLEDIEKEHIINVLAETEGNQTKASEVLGINRKTLYKKIHRYKIFS